MYYAEVHCKYAVHHNVIKSGYKDSLPHTSHFKNRPVTSMRAFLLFQRHHFAARGVWHSECKKFPFYASMEALETFNAKTMSLVYFWKSYEALIDGSTSLMTHGISLDHVDWWGPGVKRAWNGVKSFGITTSWARVKNGAKKFGCTTSGAAPPPAFPLLNPRCTQHRWSAEQARVDRGTKINGNDEHLVILAGAKKARTLEQLNCWSQTASWESSISWTSH